MNTTSEQFGKAVVAAGLISAEELQALWKALLPAQRPAHGEAFAALLVKAGKLTPYQSAEIRAGRGTALVMGDYLLVDRLGAGGMGEVFMARHRHMKRVVALKVISPQAMKDEASVKRFQREVEAAARLDHPNIVTAHDARHDRGIHYLVMQFVEGTDLAALVRKQGPLPVDLAIQCILQAAGGLAYAHHEGVIHRDIKPANLLLDKKGVVKILDMGLARLDDASVDNLTGTEQVMGTVDYMSPEQAASTHTVDGRTDMYSLGCTLWYLLTGRKIYEGETMMSRMLKHREAPIPSLCAVRDDVPYALEEIYQRMVAKLPQDRYASMQDLVRELEDLQANTSGLRRLAASGDSALNVFSEFTGPAPKSTSCRDATGTQSPVNRIGGDAPTVDFRDVGADTDPKSEFNVRPSTKVRGSQRKKSTALPLVAAALCLLAVLLGVIFIIRDQDGKELARVEAPAGSTIEVRKSDTTKSKAVSEPPGKTPPAAIAPFDYKQARAYQEAWARYLKTTVERQNGVGARLVLIPPGEFLMGSTPEQFEAAGEMVENSDLNSAGAETQRQSFDETQHRVTLAKPYWLASTEVTVGQFEKFVEASKYVTEAERYGFGNSVKTVVDSQIKPEKHKKLSWRAPGYTTTADSPVTQVTWNDAVQFCNWLSLQEKLPPCYGFDEVNGWSPLRQGIGYRLPTEAEWEFACRAGTATQFSFGDDTALLDIYGWFKKNAAGRPHAVATKVANALGLFDMHGNVWEWCDDRYASDFYAKSPPTDPVGPPSGSARVVRGGSRLGGAILCRSAERESYPPTRRGNDDGFRVLRMTVGAIAKGL